MFRRPPSSHAGPWVGVGSGVSVGTGGNDGFGVGLGGWVNGWPMSPPKSLAFSEADPMGVSYVPPVISLMESRYVRIGRATATWLSTSTSRTARKPTVE